MKTVLVIEDNLDNVRNAESAFSKTFNVVFALDLEQALREIDKMPDFVVTDMAFHQHGFSARLLEGEEDIKTPIQYLDINVGDFGLERRESFLITATRFALEESLVKSEIFNDYPMALLGSTDIALRDELVSDASSTSEYDPESNTKDYAGLVEYAKVPALGYFVIKKCREIGIPVAFLSSTRHAKHVIPAMAAGFGVEIPEWPNDNKHSEEDIETENGIFVWDYEKTSVDYWRALHKLIG